MFFMPGLQMHFGFQVSYFKINLCLSLTFLWCLGLQTSYFKLSLPVSPYFVLWYLGFQTSWFNLKCFRISDFICLFVCSWVSKWLWISDFIFQNEIMFSWHSFTMPWIADFICLKISPHCSLISWLPDRTCLSFMFFDFKMHLDFIFQNELTSSWLLKHLCLDFIFHISK